MTNSYDLVPYGSNAFPQSRPEQLAFLGRLFGIEARAPSTARVLEIGCASGGNLIPMASDFPQAHFVGVDASARQIDAAGATANALGLENVSFELADISQWTHEGEPFDYIICHGVYSWVAPAVQEAILAVLRRHLAPQGVAYVSYNTYPGWKMKEAIRDAMLFHAGRRADAQERIAQARAFVSFLKQVNDKDSPYAQFLEAELRTIEGAGDAYLFHDHLEEHNQPCYFHEFVGRAQEHDLFFLGEARLPDMAPQRFGKDIQQTIEKLSEGNILATEQYMDFVRNRAFRQSLLVHREAAARIERHLSPARLRDFFISGAIHPGGALNLEELVPMSFRAAEGASMTARSPVDKAALWVLAEAYPRVLSFDAWATAVQDLLKHALGKASVKSELGRLSQELALNGAAHFDVEPLPAVREASLPPRALAPARRLALAGARVVPGRRGVSVRIDDLQWTVLRYADGERELARLVDAVLTELEAGTLQVQRREAPAGGGSGLDSGELAGLVRGAVMALAKAGLLQ